MLISEPQQSSYDWQFRLLGFSVRVHWLFWVLVAALGYSQARGWHMLFTFREMNSNFAVLLLLWVFTAFASILIHELGHALAFRFFGVESHIVL